MRLPLLLAAVLLLAAAAPAAARTVELGTAVKVAYLFNQDPYSQLRPFTFPTRYLHAIGRPEFSSMTPEDELKMPTTWKGIGRYDWSQADLAVCVGAAQGREVRGHVLVWGQAVPDWVRRAGWSRERLQREVLRYVRDAIAHFEDPAGLQCPRIPGVLDAPRRMLRPVTEWDVLNEPSGQAGDTVRGRYRGSDWFVQRFGSAYPAFAAAVLREADRRSRRALFVNEIGADVRSATADHLLAIVRDLQERSGGAIDGVGFQGHEDFTSGHTRAQFRSNWRRFDDVVRRLQVTELDVRGPEREAGRPPSPDAHDARRQEALHLAVVGACRDVPACEKVTVWGVGDAVSWLDRTPTPDGAPPPASRGQLQHPLLLDERWQAKPTLAKVRALVSS